MIFKKSKVRLNFGFLIEIRTTPSADMAAPSLSKKGSLR